MKPISTNILIIGGGPAGYPCAIRAGQLGLDVTLVDAGGLGGTCLNRGCIPSKAYIHAASRMQELVAHANDVMMGISCEKPKLKLAGLRSWKDDLVGKLTGGIGSLLQGAGVKVVHGHAIFTDAKTCTVRLNDGGEQTYTAEHVVLATGSTEAELPFLRFDARVLSSTSILELDTLPKTLAVIGAGYIGLELGIAFAKLGTKVTFVEALDTILPQYDAEMTRPISRWLKQHKVTLHLSAKASGANKTELLFTDKDGANQSVPAEKILVAVGRKPNTSGLGLESMAIDMSGSFIQVDNQCRTSMRNVWAIGDVVGEPMLAHKGTAQGEMVAEIIAGKKRRFDPTAIAAVCFTEPEIVGVGLTPTEAKAAGEDVITGKFPFAALGKALAMQGGKDGGFVRVTARKSDHVVLGIHAVGAHVAELSGEFALAIEMGARLEDIAGTIHVHPTLTEGFAESAMSALGHPIHIKA
ncbi:MAG: dihydrolipoyl dehydrogenase [Robiginitomaculum sp.]|nr:dihydrolipoyl dehydrogenase [Robiginitomaculum sp.]